GRIGPTGGWREWSPAPVSALPPEFPWLVSHTPRLQLRSQRAPEPPLLHPWSRRSSPVPLLSCPRAAACLFPDSRPTDHSPGFAGPPLPCERDVPAILQWRPAPPRLPWSVIPAPASDCERRVPPV